MAINTERLRIAISVKDSFSKPLEKLSLQLKEIASAQQAVDENMVIDVDTRGVAAAQAKLASLGGGGGVAMASGGRRDFIGNEGLRRFFGVNRPTVEEAMSMPGPMGRAGGPRQAFRDLARTIRESDGIFSGLNLRMTDFYDVLASLLPLLLTFVGALPAAITGILTLGTAALAAAGALGGIGALAFGGLAKQRGATIGEGFQDILKEVKSDFLDAFSPLMESFTPLARDAIEGLEELFDTIAAQGHVLQQLRDDARAFGGFIMDFVPPLLASLGNLAEAFSPIFGAFAEWLKGADIIAGFAQVTRRALPSLLHLTGALVGLLPLIVDMSLGFLHVSSSILTAITAFTKLLGLFSPILNALGLTGELLGGLAGTFLVLTSVIALTTKVAATWAALLQSQVVVAIGEAIVSLHGYIAAEIGATWATLGLASATAVLLGILTFGLAPILGSITSQWFGVSESIRDATSALKKFDRLNSGVGGSGGFGPVGRGAQTVVVNNNTVAPEFNGDMSRDDQWAAANKTAYINRTMSPNR